MPQARLLCAQVCAACNEGREGREGEGHDNWLDSKRKTWALNRLGMATEIGVDVIGLGEPLWASGGRTIHTSNVSVCPACDVSLDRTEQGGRQTAKRPDVKERNFNKRETKGASRSSKKPNNQ